MIDREKKNNEELKNSLRKREREREMQKLVVKIKIIIFC